jgi:hypothetical protein
MNTSKKIHKNNEEKLKNRDKKLLFPSNPRMDKNEQEE